MKQQKKADLPQKTCVVCKRPFSWRKKWAKVWDDVKYCSDRCRMQKNQHHGQQESVR
ncbi:DUF2256 domain-containing protein [Panacibacter sp. DH6]|uniref:DUF2256 domain-containing protein n=1 Tax=Panacibacter microcysteis TaxID=2793269 RepID=A0A931E820_9BACT|nr:DUF2256 domain-containing protein [Panacibacter microcysteis]